MQHEQPLGTECSKARSYQENDDLSPTTTRM